MSFSICGRLNHVGTEIQSVSDDSGQPLNWQLRAATPSNLFGGQTWGAGRRCGWAAVSRSPSRTLGARATTRLRNRHRRCGHVGQSLRRLGWGNGRWGAALSATARTRPHMPTRSSSRPLACRARQALALRSVDLTPVEPERGRSQRHRLRRQATSRQWSISSPRAPGPILAAGQSAPASDPNGQIIDAIVQAGGAATCPRTFTLLGFGC